MKIEKLQVKKIDASLQRILTQHLANAIPEKIEFLLG